MNAGGVADGCEVRGAGSISSPRGTPVGISGRGGGGGAWQNSGLELALLINQPAHASTLQVRCQRGGQPKQVLSMATEPLPVELEWGEVLLSIRAAPINPADIYTVQTGGMYGTDHVAPPFVAGHDGVGVVVKVGPGVKGLAENDWVVPMKPNLGTWRSLAGKRARRAPAGKMCIEALSPPCSLSVLAIPRAPPHTNHHTHTTPAPLLLPSAVAKEKDLLRLPADIMPVEQCAMLREILTAYRLLEDANLKVGPGRRGGM